MVNWSFYLERMELGYKMSFLIITDRMGGKGGNSWEV
jgi:hypothetical protein